MEKRDRVFGCRSTSQARDMLVELRLAWEFTATLRLGHEWDAIAGKPRSAFGTCAHFINNHKELVATYSQTNGALHVYAEPTKLGKIFLREYNIFGRTQKWTQ